MTSFSIANNCTAPLSFHFQWRIVFFVEARTSMAFQSHSTCWSGTLPSFILVRQLIFLGFVVLSKTHHNFGGFCYFPGSEHDHKQSFLWKKSWILRKSLRFLVVQFVDFFFVFVFWGVGVCAGLFSCLFSKFFPQPITSHEKQKSYISIMSCEVF